MRIASIILTLLLIFSSVQAQEPQQQKTQQRTSTRRRSLTPSEIAKKALPSVVEIVSKDTDGSPIASGSGFLVRADLIATNYHVVKDAASIAVRIVGDKGYDRWEVGWIDDRNDLALLQPGGDIVTITLLPLPLGNIDNVKVGDEVFAVGNPQGYEGTFSQGIVSGLREGGYVQITAPISQGSSGGPILNRRGEVIGVATLIDKEGQNLNFAVSVSHLAALIKWAREREAALERSRALWDKGHKVFYYDSKGKFIGNTQETAAAARPYFEEALKIDPDYDLAWKCLGDCFFTLGRYLEASEKYAQAIRLDPDNPDWLVDLGLAYAHHAGYLSKKALPFAIIFDNKAIESLEKAASIKPADPKDLMYWGSRLKESGRLPVIDWALSKARRMAAGKPEILSDLADRYSWNNMYQDEIDVLIEYLRIKTNDDRGYQRLGTAYIKLGCSLIRNRSANDAASKLCFQEARENFKKAIRLSSPSSDPEEAIRGYEPFIIYELGVTYLEMGDKNSAIEEYKKLKDFKSKESSWLAEQLSKEIYK